MVQVANQVIKQVHVLANCDFCALFCYLFRNYFRIIDKYCLKYWSKEVLMTEFLWPQRRAYKTAIRGKLLHKGRITDLTNDGTDASVIAEAAAAF